MRQSSCLAPSRLHLPAPRAVDATAAATATSGARAHGLWGVCRNLAEITPLTAVINSQLGSRKVEQWGPLWMVPL
jgi:hypothetical protein